jgi:hypothetical protein
MTFDINLQWQSFNVDLNTIHTWMLANAGANYCGLSANNQLQVHFTADPGDSVAAAIASYWAGLTNASPEATNYMSESSRAAAAASNRAAKLASASAKLEALGLSADEIAAIVGS